LREGLDVVFAIGFTQSFVAQSDFPAVLILAEKVDIVDNGEHFRDLALDFVVVALWRLLLAFLVSGQNVLSDVRNVFVIKEDANGRRETELVQLLRSEKRQWAVVLRNQNRVRRDNRENVENVGNFQVKSNQSLRGQKEKRREGEIEEGKTRIALSVYLLFLPSSSSF
jgi:hypothetical protein